MQFINTIKLSGVELPAYKSNSGHIYLASCEIYAKLGYKSKANLLRSCSNQALRASDIPSEEGIVKVHKVTYVVINLVEKVIDRSYKKCNHTRSQFSYGLLQGQGYIRGVMTTRTQVLP